MRKHSSSVYLVSLNHREPLMAPRHQVFLIARIRPHSPHSNEEPARHRCVAAFDHESCSGYDAVLGAHRFLTTLARAENAAVVRAELSALDGKYGSHGTQEPLIPAIPCPFTTYLLSAAWCAVDSRSPSPY